MPIAQRSGTESRSFGVLQPGFQSSHPIFTEERLMIPTFRGSGSQGANFTAGGREAAAAAESA